MNNKKISIAARALAMGVVAALVLIGSLAQVEAAQSQKASYGLLWSYETGGTAGKVSVSSDGSYIAAGSQMDYMIYFFNQEGKLLWNYDTGHYVFDISVSSDGSYIAAGSGNKVYFFTNLDTVQKVPAITLTKSLSPSTITEGDSTTVTIRVENTGGDAKNVKIVDAIPQGFTLVSGSASQEYATLKATESRTFQYTIKATGTGRFVSDLATVTYQDDKGNSYSGASNSATITVQAGQAGQVSAAQPKTPGFGAILAGIGIILVLAFRRR